MSLQNGHVEDKIEDKDPSSTLGNIQKVKPSSTTEEREENRKLFVGGLTSETSEKNLSDYFVNFGEVVSCAVKICRETGQSRGFGFVVFKDEESVKKVLSTPEHRLNGKKIDPKPAKCNKDTQRKVFVGGLDPEVTQEQVEEHFSQFGKVEAVDLPFDNIKGRRKNYVFVVFSSENEAKKAASVERQEICGKSCDVRVAVHREASFRQRAQLQQSPLELQQMLFNLTYALNSAPINPAFLLHNPLAVTGSLSPWNFTGNQHLSCPQRPDGMRVGRAGATNSVVKTNFRPSVFGVDSQYVNGVDKHPASQYAANLASQFNSSVSLNPSTSANLATAESAWDPGNSSSEAGLSRSQQQATQQQQQQQQAPPLQHSGGVYVSSASTAPTANSIAPSSSAYALRSVDYTNGGSPYLTFAQPGYQLQPGQSSMPYFYPVGPSGGYLAAAAAAAAAGGGAGTGQNPTLYHHQPMAASALGAGPQANASPAPAPGFHQIGLPNPNLQGPFVNDFMTMLAANQVGMPFLAYPPNATAGLVGLQFRQQTMNPYYQPANGATTDGISALPGFPSADPSAPRPLLYGAGGGPTTVATTTTNTVRHTLLSPHYSGDQQSRTTAPRHAAKQGYNSNSGSTTSNAGGYQRPPSGSNSVGRGGGGGGGRFSCSHQPSTTATEVVRPSANGDCPNTPISSRAGEEGEKTVSAEKQSIKTSKSSSPTSKHLLPATPEASTAPTEDKTQNEETLPTVTSSLAVTAGSQEVADKLGATGPSQPHSSKKNNQLSQTSGNVAASLMNGVKHEASESVSSAADSVSVVSSH